MCFLTLIQAVHLKQDPRSKEMTRFAGE